MTTFQEAPVKEYELCDKCEQAMEEAGVFGHTVQEMFEMGATFYFDMAFILMGEGHYLTRESEEDKEFPRMIAIIETKDSCEENPHYEIATIDPETDKVTAYIQLSNQDILASDWKIAKVKQEG